MVILYVLAKLTGNSVHYQRYEVLLNIIEHLVHLKMCTQAEGDDWKASHLGNGVFVRISGQKQVKCHFLFYPNEEVFV